MSDFFQNGIVTTLQDVGGRSVGELEREITDCTRHCPVTLVLPCLATELDHQALDRIVIALTGVPYLSRVIIGLDRADAASYKKAIAFFARLPQPHRVIWNDGPRVAALLDELQHLGLAPIEKGKGHNLWISFGLLQAEELGGIVATHDCDIVNYTSRFLARLVYPLVYPNTNYVFAKAYYARVSQGRLYGRASRLFMTPFLRALKRSLAPDRYLDYLDSFRYPLAGECAMHVDVARRLYLTTDWGLEVGILSEIYSNHSTRHICQVDVADTYDHKHQPVGNDVTQIGLSRMCWDIALRVMQGLAAQGHVLDLSHVRTIVVAYQRIVQDLINSYADVAAINGLTFDRGEETLAASTFSDTLYAAGSHFVSQNYRHPIARTWDEIIRSQPNILVRLRSAVLLDRDQYGVS